MIRNTMQRTVVYEAVNKLKNHATADEIYTTIHQDHPAVSKGTVYRNLQKLCDEGLIRKRQIPGEVDRYDHICTDHYHGKCVKCGCVLDLNIQYIPGLEQYISQADEFEVLGHDIVFSGICAQCKKAAK